MSRSIIYTGIEDKVHLVRNVLYFAFVLYFLQLKSTFSVGIILESGEVKKYILGDIEDKNKV